MDVTLVFIPAEILDSSLVTVAATCGPIMDFSLSILIQNQDQQGLLSIFNDTNLNNKPVSVQGKGLPLKVSFQLC